jgi:hypothetical protein
MFDEDYGVQSYFGESDSNFFGDTSNDMIFGEGYGQPVTNGQQFFSEAVGFSSTGGEFISEAAATGGYGEMITECGDLYEESSNSTRSHFGDMAETDSKFRVDRMNKRNSDKSSKVNDTFPSDVRQHANSTYVTPQHKLALDRAKSHDRDRPNERPQTPRMEKQYASAKRRGREIGRRLDSNSTPPGESLKLENL